MMTEAQQIVMSEAPWIFVAYPGYHLARRANLKGFHLLHVKQHAIPGLHEGRMIGKTGAHFQTAAGCGPVFRGGYRLRCLI